MTETPQVVRSYLHELEGALRGMPAAERQEIIGGVREELTGLDEAAASERIELLGDPAFIAAQAREAAGDVTPAGRESFGYAVVASLLVAFGGIVVPILGWIVGLGMVWFSRTWSVGEKLIGTLAAPVLGAIGVAVSLLLETSATAESASPTFGSSFSFAHGSLLIVPVVYIVSGLWLLARARRTVRPPA